MPLSGGDTSTTALETAIADVETAVAAVETDVVAVETALGSPYQGPVTGLTWTNFLYQEITVYTGAGKLYYVIFTNRKSTTQYMELNDATSGVSNRLFLLYATQYEPVIVLDLMNNPISFSTGLRIGDLSEKYESFLGVKLCYKPD